MYKYTLKLLQWVVTVCNWLNRFNQAAVKKAEALHSQAVNTECAASYARCRAAGQAILDAQAVLDDAIEYCNEVNGVELCHRVEVRRLTAVK